MITCQATVVGIDDKVEKVFARGVLTVDATMVIVGARCLCMPPGSGSAASCAPAIARAERARIAPGLAAQG